MKFVSHLQGGKEKAAVLHENCLYNTEDLNPQLPATMLEMLENWDTNFPLAKEAINAVAAGTLSINCIPFAEAQLLAPVPRPTSCRDGYAFRQHVAAARRNRGVPMIPEFDQYPIFYFTNHNAIQGPGDIECMPDHFEKLDFELEVAAIVGKKGRNIPAAEADKYIAGYCIMNDMSARTLQMEEMLLNLGPAKGKDFSTVIGPWMVTPDELEPFRVPAKPNHVGNSYHLRMTCKVNGEQVSEGNMEDMDWTFAEILERCAYGADILPGDVIGSGTVGTGCFLELNGTAKLNNPDAVPQWLQPNDVIEMEIEGMGKLVNTIKAVDTDFSILKLKKMP
ncbi:MAG TPA: fumarylacetoacetate hydrolase family protein [Edaphocola sp.]|nr:fumarylacetoacetate hydrolase family protein [Edaphocola sp.]